MKQTKRTLHRAGWRIELDRSEIYPEDPGLGTPALVIDPHGLSTTFLCAVSTGEMNDGAALPDDIHAWLERSWDEVEQFLA